MGHSALLCLLLMYAVHTLAAPLQALEEVDCAATGGVVTLEVKAGTVTIPDIVSFDVRAYHVNGKSTPSVPSALIKMTAGATCSVRVVNNLVGTACNGAHENTFHCPDTTTLHTHGLHVSPNDDNIDTHVEPNGGEYTYTYNIPENHLMGTHWYHAHHHGSTAMQVSGGMVGVLYVMPHASYSLPADLAALYEAPDALPPLVFHHLQMSTVYRDNLFTFMDYPTLLEQTENNVPLNLNWIDDSVSGQDFYTVNGQFNPTLTVTAGKAALLRMVHAGHARHISLSLDTPGCTMTLLARDGVFHYTPYLEIESIAMIQGTRSDVAILCPASLAGQTINVKSSTAVGIQPSSANGHDQTSFFQIEVVAGSNAVPIPTSQAPLPTYLDDLSQLTQYNRGGLKGIKGVGFSSDKNVNLGVNGAAFAGFDEPDPDLKYLDEFCLGEVYQTKLGGNGAPDNIAGPALSPTPPHPYHHHINHFQIQDSLDPSGTVLRTNEWRDVAPEWELYMRWRPVDYEGDVVVHCHILQHEDRGMMALYNVKNCNPTLEPTLSPFDTPAPETPSPDTPAPDTTAPDTTAPDTIAPDTIAPDTTAPDTTAPDTVAPDTTAPDTTAPGTVAPDTTAPDTTVPETLVPPPAGTFVKACNGAPVALTKPAVSLSYEVGSVDGEDAIRFTLEYDTPSAGWGALGLRAAPGAAGMAELDIITVLSTEDGATDRTIATGFALSPADAAQDVTFVSRVSGARTTSVFFRKMTTGDSNDFSFVKGSTINLAVAVGTVVASELSKHTSAESIDVVLTTCDTNAPPTDAPATPFPETAAPDTLAPMTQAPDTTAPQTMSPETANPTASPTALPVGETPAPTAIPTTVPTAVPTTAPTSAPDTTAPDTTAPATSAPPTSAPDTTAPDTVSPDTIAPDTPAPDTTAPDTTAPDTTAPDTVAPDTTAPDTTVPETLVPPPAGTFVKACNGAPVALTKPAVSLSYEVGSVDGEDAIRFTLEYDTPSAGWGALGLRAAPGAAGMAELDIITVSSTEDGATDRTIATGFALSPADAAQDVTFVSRVSGARTTSVFFRKMTTGDSNDFSFVKGSTINLAVAVGGGLVTTSRNMHTSAESIDVVLTTCDTIAPTSLPVAETLVPTIVPTAAPTSLPAGVSAAPTAVPTSVPTAVPTLVPTSLPAGVSAAPTVVPTSVPTVVPTSLPAGASSAPTAVPTSAPTAVPTVVPTSLPAGVSAAPTAVPTSAPTAVPTVVPTSLPAGASAVPTVSPTSVPTSLPAGASASPTAVPTSAPTLLPAGASAAPTAVPTAVPTSLPAGASAAPTVVPTSAPTSLPAGSTLVPAHATPLPEGETYAPNQGAGDNVDDNDDGSSFPWWVLVVIGGVFLCLGGAIFAVQKSRQRENVTLNEIMELAHELEEEDPQEVYPALSRAQL